MYALLSVSDDVMQFANANANPQQAAGSATRSSRLPDKADEMSTARFTDELRASCIEEWNRVINHQFTTELATGEISRDVLRKYLIQVGSFPTRLDRNNSSKVPRHKPQDHRFLDSFVVLLSSMVAKARCLEDRIPGCQFLALITGDENNYFQRSFDSLGCGDTERRQIPNENVTSDFIKLMKDASQGTLGEMLSVLVVCEWSYLSWGERVVPITKRSDGATFLTYEWVDLHSGDHFASGRCGCGVRTAKAIH